jgi:signal transduction histidine kinase
MRRPVASEARTGPTSTSTPTGVVESISAVDLGRFTSSRVERAIEVVVGFGCSLLGAQGLAAAVGGAETADALHPVLELFVFVPLGLMIVACFTGRAVKLFAALFSLVGVVGIAVWPIVHHSPVSGQEQPWIFFLLNVITAATLLAFPLVWQIVLVVFVPLEWLVVRLVQSTGAPFDVPLFLLEASFALVLGSIVVTLGWLFRRVAATVDRRRAEADASYAEAIAADAAEQERLAVGALMHDSVLSALIAAARGHSSRERLLAVSMASEALTRLADAEQDASMGPEGPVSLVVIAQQLQRVAEDLGVTITVPAPEVAVPSDVARALAMAGVQAITNAVEHAGGTGLAASITATDDPPRVQVTVSDCGSGFDTSKVPDDRLGISASIMARMAAVRGRAAVDSGRDGTTVTLTWTASERVA